MIEAFFLKEELKYKIMIIRWLRCCLFWVTSFGVFGLESEKPLAVIFLDIDGVLIAGRDTDPLNAWIRERLIDLFGKKDREFRGYSELEWRIAAGQFLSRAAVENLENLIDRVNKTKQIAIVVSSAWRLDGTVDEIKDRMFEKENFSRWIIDKVADDDWWRQRKNENRLSPIAIQKYGFGLDARGAQIEYWLRENHQKWNIDSFVIIDDCDDGISRRFPGNFVEVYRLFSSTEAELAYEILMQSPPDLFSKF
ncbi:MAG: hypothetical protein KGI80_03465 [Verrucomicrobiota bacterium]|nr:hypothetical protein [Verrucomicrobiota bacterium]